jgi:hypothetical protein
MFGPKAEYKIIFQVQTKPKFGNKYSEWIDRIMKTRHDGDRGINNN